MMAKSGQMGVPVILAEDPSRPGAPDVIVGFDRPRLEQLASRVAAGVGAGGASASAAGGGSAGKASPAGDPPRLGLRVKDAPSGVLVDAVHPGSLADRAGLRAGDAVLAVDGQPVRSADDLAAAARRLAAGAPVEVTVRRDGQVMRAHIHP